MVFWLTAHYLGRKHRCSLRRVMRNAYGVDPSSGKRALYTNRGGKRVYLWNKPPPWQSLFRARVEAKDVQPLPMASWTTGHSYEQRQEAHARAEHRCEHCGTPASSLIVHHPNRLATGRSRKLGPAKLIASGQEQHVKVLCPGCHQYHHPGSWGGAPRKA